MRESLNRLAVYFPWVGIVFLILGAAAYFITRNFDLLTNLLLGMGALFLLLFAVLRPDDVRRLLGQRQTRYGTAAFLSVLFFATIGILIYWIALQNPDWRYDATEENAFTPLPETVELLEGLEDPVHVIAFYSPNLAFEQDRARSVLEGLEAAGGNLSFEFRDPESNPLLAEQYDLNFDGTLVFVRNQGEVDETFAKANSLNESDVHGALLKIVSPVAKKAYFLTGHGELDIESFEGLGMATAIGVIEDQGFEVESLNLFSAGAVPEDASLVALIGQQGPLDPSEVEALTTYVDAGGSLFLAREPVDTEGRAAAETDGLASWLEENWGVRLRNDLIIDQDLAQAGQTFGLAFIGDSYGTHPIVTEELRTFGTRFVVARSVETLPEAGLGVTALVNTSPNAWGETDIAGLISQGLAEQGPEDLNGPLAVGIAAEDTESGARLVVFGDADFVNNEIFLFGGNSILFPNALNWLVDDELTIDLAPRESITRQVNIPQTQLSAWLVASICLAPALLGVIGLGVYVSRRRRR